MPLIYRRDLNRPLTFEEMDGNLEYLDRYAEDVEVVVEHLEEIETVAASINGVNAVAGSITSVVTTSLHVDNIDTVAGDVTNIDAVAGISSEVTAVAGVATEIAAVYADLANIDAVAGDLTNIDALAAVSTDISTVASIEADVTTVAGISSDVSTLSAISDDILTVSSINGNVTTVANNSANITTVATNIAEILAAQGYADDAATSAGEAAASALEALGYLSSTEAVYLNFDERYLGAKATPPTTDNQGQPLTEGALYFDTAIGFMYVYHSSAWQSIAAAGGVDSVNGQTGDVVLDYEDVGAYSTSQVDTLLSAKADDSAVVHDTGTESVAGVKTFTDGIITADLQFSGGTGSQGLMSWNADEETVDLIQDGATLQLGQELQVHCRNNTASNIGNAVVVMATGTLGMSGRITIAPWDGTTDIKYILGVTTEVIEAGTDGKVTTFGKVRDVDTGAISGTLTTGVIYAKTDGTGGLTYTKPSSNAVPLAFLVSAESAPSANNGTIMVRVTPVSETILDHAETAYGWGNHASAGYATASNLSAHTSNTSNPHSVTATQVGLGNVTNESKATMFTSPAFTGNAVLGAPASGDFSTGTFTWPTFNQNTSGNAATATYATSAGDAGTLDSHDSTYFATASGLSSHTSNTSNPHSVTAAQVGAYTTGSVDTLLAAKVSKTASTGSAVMPSGTTGERDGSPAAGYMRFNTTLSKFEGYDGSAWSSVGGGATSLGYFFKADSSSVAFSKTGNGTATIKAGTIIDVLGTRVEFASATSITMPTLTSGTDYAVWVKDDATTIQASSNHTSPPASGNWRKIGGFHYAPGGNATGTSGGDTTPSINAYSFWDLKFRPACPDPRGMTLVADGFWIDIYLTGVDAITNGSSKYNVTMADGSSPPKVPTMFGGNGSTTYGSYTWFEAMELATAFGKKCPTQQEFMSAMYGTTEASSVGSDQGSTVLNAAYTSKWGVIQSTGVLWAWGRDRGGAYNTGGWSASTDGRGSEYNAPNAVLLGGLWSDGSYSGSRCSNWTGAASYSNNSVGSRFCCDHLQLD